MAVIMNNKSRLIITISIFINSILGLENSLSHTDKKLLSKITHYAYLEKTLGIEATLDCNTYPNNSQVEELIRKKGFEDVSQKIKSNAIGLALSTITFCYNFPSLRSSCISLSAMMYFITKIHRAGGQHNGICYRLYPGPFTTMLETIKEEYPDEDEALNNC